MLYSKAEEDESILVREDVDEVSLLVGGERHGSGGKTVTITSKPGGVIVLAKKATGSF